MSTLAQLGLLIAFIMGSLSLLVFVLKVLVDRQNRQVLRDRADTRLQAILQAGGFLQRLADDPSIPEPQREAARRLAQDYPEADQLRVFARRLLEQLDLK